MEKEEGVEAGAKAMQLCQSCCFLLLLFTVLWQHLTFLIVDPIRKKGFLYMPSYDEYDDYEYYGDFITASLQSTYASHEPAQSSSEVTSKTIESLQQEVQKLLCAVNDLVSVMSAALPSRNTTHSYVINATISPLLF